MRNTAALFCGVLAAVLAACARAGAPPAFPVDVRAARAAYGDSVTVTPLDDSVAVTRGTITLSPREEGATYTISGYFNGQVVSRTKNTVIRLDNAYLENSAGKAALRFTAKTEVAAARGSTNYLVSSGRGYARSAALEGKRDLAIGGGGTLYVAGYRCHGVEAEDVRLKGSGTYYLQGTWRGSALNCESLAVDGGKEFRCYLLNSKNGVKADHTISIASGTFYLYGNGTAFKTDTAREAPGSSHGIMLSGGTFHTAGNGALYLTDDGAYLADGAIFMEDTL